MPVFSKLLFVSDAFPWSTEASPIDTEGAPFNHSPASDLYLADSGKMTVKVIRQSLRTRYNDCLDNILAEMASRVSTVSHSNISPVRLVSSTVDGVTAIIREYYANGNIRTYITANPAADRLPLLLDAASGLACAHGKGLVHGNFKPENLLVDNHGTVLVSDFQVDKILCHYDSCTTGRIVIPSGWMYKAVEALFPLGPHDIGQADTAADVASFAYTAYEILTGLPPFKRGPPGSIPLRILRLGDEVIPRPTRMDSELWDLLSKCWDSNAQNRPTMATIVGVLEKIHHRH